MLRTLFAHMRQNVVAYLALFVALGGTSAWAADTVFSSDIVDGEVKSVDIGDGEVQSVDVTNGTLQAQDYGIGSVSGARIQDNNVTTLDLADNAIFGNPDIANNSLTGSDIADRSLDYSEISAVQQTALQEDPPSVGANSCIVEETSSIAGKTSSDLAFLFPPPAFPPGLVVASAIDLNDTTQASYRLCNVTNSPIDSAQFTFRILIIDVN